MRQPLKRLFQKDLEKLSGSEPWSRTSLGVQELSIGASGAGLTINVIREQIKADPLTEPQRIQRMVADLRAEIIDKSLISALT